MSGRTDEKPSHKGSQPLYEIIRDQLINEIESGRTYPAGALLPSIREITVKWTVSTTTARKALAEVVMAGYAQSEGPRGHVSTGPKDKRSTGHSIKEQLAEMLEKYDDPRAVLEWIARNASGRDDELLSALGEVLNHADALTVRTPQTISGDGVESASVAAVDVRKQVAPPEVALALRLPDSTTPVLVRRRVAVDDHGMPLQLRTSYLINEVAEGTPLAEPAAIDETWRAALAAHTGRRPQLAQSQITARHPTDYEAAALGLAPTECLLVRVDVTEDENGVPFDYTETVWPGESTRLTTPRQESAK